MSEITVLLRSIEDGDSSARNLLFERVYAQLKAMARKRLATERAGHTLQATALVHEAYLRLFRGDVDADQKPSNVWNGSRHFYGAAANAMRQILIEAARRKQSKKRGGEFSQIVIDPDELFAPETADEFIALDESMRRFEQAEPVIAELVRLRFFAGLTLKQAAVEIQVSARTADDYWAYAKAWLATDMQDRSEAGDGTSARQAG